jgi:hypothetical protein
LPLPPLLHQWDLVLSMAISNSDEDVFAFACDEHVIFLEYIDALFVKTETVSSSAVLPMLIKEVGKSWNVSTWIARAESCQNGSWVTYLALLVPPLATPTFRVDGRRMERPALR